MDLNAQWIVGFVDGEGCFYIGINRNQTMKFGVQILPELRLAFFFARLSTSKGFPESSISISCTLTLPQRERTKACS